MKEVRWGIIGCGEVTEKKSGPAFNEVEGSHVEAVFSRNETKARSYAERHHVRKWYTDPQELILDPDINRHTSCRPHHVCHHVHACRQTVLRREAPRRKL